MSVMDYPHPVIELDAAGNVELREAYPTGIGDWDKVFVQYGYTDFAPGTDEEEALEAILMDAEARGLTFISDQDARPPGSAHPQVHLWDNGSDVVDELDRMMDVRRVALDRFGQAAIKEGMPLATMEEALVPLYLHHRYQAEAAAKVVGGLYYTYAMRGDGQQPLRQVPAEEQMGAVEALLRTLDPAELAFPRSILDQLPPRPFRYQPHQELFNRNTGLVFDAVAPATAAADMTLAFLFHPERAARLVQQSALHSDLPGLEDVFHQVLQGVFAPEYADAYHAEINRAVERVVVDRVMALAGRAPMAQVRALANQALVGLQERLGEDARGADGQALGFGPEAAHAMALAEDIGRFRRRPHAPLTSPAAPPAPPGSPIGDQGMAWTNPAWWWSHHAPREWSAWDFWWD
jgi:hypothetical protein